MIKYLIRPYELLTKKQDKSCTNPYNLKYGIAAVPLANKKNWIVGAEVSLIFECIATGNSTIIEKIVEFQDDQVILNNERLTEQTDIQESFINQAKQNIGDIELFMAKARNTINKQIWIEFAIVLLAIAISLFSLGLIISNV